MNPKEQQAVDMLRTGVSWKEATQRTGFTETRLQQLFQSWQEVQQAKVEAHKQVKQ